jgi:hypothetical protein
MPWPGSRFSPGRTVSQDTAADPGKHDIRRHRRIPCRYSRSTKTTSPNLMNCRRPPTMRRPRGHLNGRVVRARPELHLSSAWQALAAGEGTQGRWRRGHGAASAGSRSPHHDQRANPAPHQTPHHDQRANPSPTPNPAAQGLFGCCGRLNRMHRVEHFSHGWPQRCSRVQACRRLRDHLLELIWPLAPR